MEHGLYSVTGVQDGLRGRYKHGICLGKITTRKPQQSCLVELYERGFEAVNVADMEGLDLSQGGDEHPALAEAPSPLH